MTIEIKPETERLVQEAIHSGRFHSVDELIAASLAGKMATLDWSQCPAVESVPGKVSGAWVFRGTRMPVSTVFENLEDGMTVDEVMEQFPVTREQIKTVLEFAARSLDAPLTHL
jgi:uncharacterized protein (DUF433 family)